MKKLSGVFLLTAVVLMTAPQARAGFGSGLPGVISDFNMTTCREEKGICYHVVSPRAEGTVLKRLYALENVNLTIENSKSAEHTTENWSLG